MTKSNIVVACSILASIAGAAHAAVGDPCITIGGPVTVQVLSSDAGFTSELHLSSPGPDLFIATNRDTGLVANIGTFATGTELIFSIYVRDTGRTFYTGDASRNPDGLAHANVTYLGNGVTSVEFEDIFGGGDQDYNDVRFTFTGIVPTPGSLAVLGFGAMGITRRRRTR